MFIYSIYFFKKKATKRAETLIIIQKYVRSFNNERSFKKKSYQKKN